MEWVQYVIFALFALMVLGGGILTVAQRNVVRSAGALVLSLFGVAGLYVLLEAGFLAAIQVLVYIGAIAILIIFTIMVTRRVAQGDEAGQNSQWAWSLLPTIALFGVLVYVISTVWPITWQAGPVEALAAGATTSGLGLALLDPGQFVLPFEVASVLLLGAMVGAIVIAKEKREE